jgi:hypothetical protein
MGFTQIENSQRPQRSARIEALVAKMHPVRLEESGVQAESQNAGINGRVPVS